MFIISSALFRRLVPATLVFLVMAPGQPVGAQPYTEGKTQHRFAQTYAGLNLQWVPASGRLVWQGREQAFPSLAVPRFSIGGLHFWGKLDFQMNLSLTNLASNDLSNDGEADLNPGSDLSARFYPWRMRYGRLRPYAGVSLNSMSLRLGNATQGDRFDSFITTSLLGGLSFATNDWQLNAELMYLPRNDRHFYSSETRRDRLELPSAYFSFGLVKYFDVTLGEEKPKLSGLTAALEAELLAKGKLNSISVGLAPSAAFFLEAPHLAGEWASLPRHKGSFNWDLGLGYFFHRPNLHVGLSYRIYSSNAVSYQLEHIIKRQSLALEGYKFFWNYHGFVPFVGVTLSAERWAAGVFRDDRQVGPTDRSRMLSPGIIFGWDILPSPLETWVLRTNLRYYPWQKIAVMNDDAVRVDQFEFNFIQLVFYPNRWWHIRRARKKQP